jgi:hypothetical protein
VHEPRLGISTPVKPSGEEDQGVKEMRRAGSIREYLGSRERAFLIALALGVVVGSTVLSVVSSQGRARHDPASQTATQVAPAPETTEAQWSDAEPAERQEERLDRSSVASADLPLLWAVRTVDPVGINLFDDLIPAPHIDSNTLVDEPFPIVASQWASLVADTVSAGSRDFPGATPGGGLYGGSVAAYGAGSLYGVARVARVGTEFDAASGDNESPSADGPVDTPPGPPTTIFLPGDAINGGNGSGASPVPSLNGETILAPTVLLAGVGGPGGPGGAGEVTGSDLRSVPEPSTLFIFGLGLVLLGRALGKAVHPALSSLTTRSRK